MSRPRSVFQDSELDLGLPPAPPPPELEWPAAHEATRFVLPGSRLPGMSTSLFVQGYTDEPMDVARLVEHTRVGAVFTVRHNRAQSPLQLARGAVELVRGRTLSTSILVDRNCYAGRNRKSAVDGLSNDWIEQQHGVLRLRWALTDSGFADSLSGVRRILNDAATVRGDVIVLLPIPFELLRDEAVRLVELVDENPHPVAVAIRHPGDPFDEPGVAAGLVYLLQHADRPVLVLRCDTSALGAISFGAAVGAVGSTGLRHIFPAENGGGGPVEASLLVPNLLAYTTLTRFAQAYLRDPSLDAWRCRCWFCRGRDLVWVAASDATLAHRAAFQHSAAALAALGAALAESPDRNMAAAWTTMCGEARRRHEFVAAGAGSSWKPKGALQHWHSLAPVSQPR